MALCFRRFQFLTVFAALFFLVAVNAKAQETPVSKSELDKKIPEVYHGQSESPHEINPAIPARAKAGAAAQGGEDMFWTFTNALFEDGLSRGQLNDFAKKQELDVDQFSQCRQDEKFADRVDKHKSETQSVGISGTPGIVLVNKKYGEHEVISGAMPVSKLKSKIEKLRE